MGTDRVMLYCPDSNTVFPPRPHLLIAASTWSDHSILEICFVENAILT